MRIYPRSSGTVLNASDLSSGSDSSLEIVYKFSYRLISDVQRVEFVRKCCCSAVIGDEVMPGSSVQSDEDWDTWLAKNIGTEYHPSCSCAMLPLEQGGVVDENLKVYGLANVRVADASVFPISFSAHVSVALTPEFLFLGC